MDEQDKNVDTEREDLDDQKTETKSITSGRPGSDKDLLQKQPERKLSKRAQKRVRTF